MSSGERGRSLCVENKVIRIALVGAAEELWRYEALESGKAYGIEGPEFEVDGEVRRAALREIDAVCDPVRLANGCTEHRFEGKFADDSDLSLEIVFRVAEENPVVRFRYVLRSGKGRRLEKGRRPGKGRRLTKAQGRDRLGYLGVSLAELPEVTEVRFGEFNEVVHSYCLAERAVGAQDFDNELRAIGPMLVGEADGEAMLVAYEHGATALDSFLEFALAKDRSVGLRAVKGNYFHGQPLDAEHPYETVWLQFAAVAGGQEALAREYRSFVLHDMSLNEESRKPRIFYNTWNYQERNHHWNGRPYLESMNQERMLEEIEVAHRMGIEVFVIDTGWYQKTGDWEVNRERFPDGLKAVKEKLDGYGMKLGLWFNPTVAGASSKMFSGHRECVKTWRGKEPEPGAIWETEESYPMCLVSRYADAFADELIRLNKEVGVTYFKWDAADQHGCDDPRHWHGGPENSEEERADCFGFEMGRAMCRVADRVGEAVPEAMVDFDVTEAGRYVGLGWLAASRYYLVNNGPYYRDYNVPLPPDQNWNMFFYPGPARGWICRRPLTYDKWIPSVLFMTHYLTDDPGESQLINVGSLILGQNGMWGDLPGVSEEGVERIGHLLGLYRQVREDAAESYPVRSGAVGGSPEIHEKIWDRTGRGVVVAFATRRGRYRYVTRNRVADGWWHTDGVEVRRDERGRAVVGLEFESSGAKVVFFGVG